MALWIGRIGYTKTILLAMLGVMPPVGVLAQSPQLPPPPPSSSGQPSTLPPMPSTPVPSAPLPTTVTVPRMPSQRPRQPDLPQFNQVTPTERIYQQTPSVRSPQFTSGRYRVVVDTDSPEVLQQVRFVQPDAFVQNVGGRRLIQAGLFNNEANARDQVSRLAYQGINARVTNPSGSGIENGALVRGYYVIVPGGRDAVQRYYNRAIEIGVSASVLQLRDRPLGTHLAVGPFSNVGEAEQVQKYLRDRGSLDARLYYDR